MKGYLETARQFETAFRAILRHEGVPEEGMPIEKIYEEYSDGRWQTGNPRVLDFRKPETLGNTPLKANEFIFKSHNTGVTGNFTMEVIYSVEPTGVRVAKVLDTRLDTNGDWKHNSELENI